MVSENCSDRNIIQLIKSLEEAAENLATRCLYKVYGGYIKKILAQKVGQSRSDLVVDILTDTILAFFNSIRQNRFELRNDKSIKGYLSQTAKNLLNLEIRALYKGSTKPEKNEHTDEIVAYLLNQMSDEGLKRFKENLSKDPVLQEEVELKRQLLFRQSRVVELSENLKVIAPGEIEQVEAMKTLISELSPLQQQILNAHYHQGIGLATLAENFNMSPEAVRQQHHRSLKKLRNLFTQKKQKN